MRFEQDLFISYAHNDNIAKGEREGWVTRLDTALREALTTRIGRNSVRTRSATSLDRVVSASGVARAITLLASRAISRRPTRRLTHGTGIAQIRRGPHLRSLVGHCTVVVDRNPSHSRRIGRAVTAEGYPLTRVERR